MGKTRSSKTLVSCHITTRCHNSEDHNLKKVLIEFVLLVFFSLLVIQLNYFLGNSVIIFIFKRKELFSYKFRNDKVEENMS